MSAGAHPGRSHLQQFALGELNAERHDRIAAHLEVCEPCAEQVRAERALDELILQSAPVVGPRSAEQALDRMWAAVDAGELHAADTAVDKAPKDAPLTHLAGGRLRAVVGLAAAAALLLIVFGPWGDAPADPADPADNDTTLADDGGVVDPSSPDSGVANVAPDANGVLDPSDVPAPDALGPGALGVPGAPAPAEPLDMERLAATRTRVIDALLGASLDEFSPRDAASQVSAELAPLRAEGWPVDAHLRSLVLGRDLTLAERALTHVAFAGGSPSLIAEALRAGVGGDEVLELLPLGQLALAESPSLIATLAERASHSARARALLIAEPSTRTRRALNELLDSALDDSLVAALGAAVDPPVALQTLFDELPPELALPGLVKAGDPSSDASPARLEWARTRFLALAKSSPDIAADALRPLIESRAPQDARFAWMIDARLEMLVPAFARRLESRELADGVRAQLARLASPAAAYALFVDFSEDLRGEADPGYLRHMLLEQPELAEALGARAAGAHGAALLDFAESLPSAQAEALLLGALFALPAGSDPKGRRAGLLGALARVGSESAGHALLARVDALPDNDPLLPLAWATAGRLAGPAASERWRAGGGDPTTLAQVAADVGERFDRAVRPSPRLLRPLARELPLLAAGD
ncbi:MAG: hypothetical protein DHS20C15_26000 [Planctomycetota bacterium]|nr:MAG: hypothetical protein DHS20C15_26000 [Planctomycetota bacterium]